MAISRPEVLRDDGLSKLFPALLRRAAARRDERKPAAVFDERREAAQHQVAIHPVERLAQGTSRNRPSSRETSSARARSQRMFVAARFAAWRSPSASISGSMSSATTSPTRRESGIERVPDRSRGPARDTGDSSPNSVRRNANASQGTARGTGRRAQCRRRAAERSRPDARASTTPWAGAARSAPSRSPSCRRRGGSTFFDDASSNSASSMSCMPRPCPPG